jgi:hypothetical protein
VQSFAGASRRLLVVVGLQHIPARILAEFALPQNAQTRKSHSHRHRGYRKECELKLEAWNFQFSTNFPRILQVFGALTSCSLHVSDHFYGTGESLLYKFNPSFKVFHWSGENLYFIKGNPESLAIGAGE